MVAPKPGHRVLVAGTGDPQLTAEIAVTTGLNGLTLARVADDAARQRVNAAAAEAGSLVETDVGDVLPFSAAGDGFDIVVLHAALGDAAGGQPIVNEAFRLVRPGGRVVAIEGATRQSGRWAMWRTPMPKRTADEVRALLDTAGFRATRVLADLPGVSYVEGVKARP